MAFSDHRAKAILALRSIQATFSKYLIIASLTLTINSTLKSPPEFSITKAVIFR